MTTFREAKGRQVVATATAQTVGKVDGFVVDPAAGRVVALTVKKQVLRWADLTLGPDAVTVPEAERLTEPDEELARLSGKHREALGKRVLSAGGDELGTVSDIEFVPETGEITALLLGDDRVAGGRLLGIGSYAVVVRTSD